VLPQEIIKIITRSSINNRLDGFTADSAEMGKLIFEEETYRIIGDGLLLHKGLDAGFLESVYHAVLEKEFETQKVTFESKKKLQVYYNQKPWKKYFKANFMCFDKIVGEIKATLFLHKDIDS
jgi:GxxExxY protein